MFTVTRQEYATCGTIRESYITTCCVFLYLLIRTTVTYTIPVPPPVYHPYSFSELVIPVTSVESTPRMSDGILCQSSEQLGHNHKGRRLIPLVWVTKNFGKHFKSNFPRLTTTRFNGFVNVHQREIDKVDLPTKQLHTCSFSTIVQPVIQF